MAIAFLSENLIVGQILLERRIRRCHTGILHCTDNLESLYNIILSKFCKFLDRAMKSESALIRNVFHWSATRPYTTYGFNIANKTRSYSLSDQLCAQYYYMCGTLEQAYCSLTHLLLLTQFLKPFVLTRLIVHLIWCGKRNYNYNYYRATNSF